MELYFIRDSSLDIVNGMQGEFSDSDGEPTHFDESTPTTKDNRNDEKINNANIIRDL
ncbi:42382_t:CDS:2 [Gigaspora margarita]|uniref:42382_t:CDS:1 n=1 Tax=Gigaspora margarita TaxID=4874 RepID=A0ABN7VRE4_GIGMA|nr:42382_t:CDS:2 [Gigaspora margarita]